MKNVSFILSNLIPYFLDLLNPFNNQCSFLKLTQPCNFSSSTLHFTLNQSSLMSFRKASSTLSYWAQRLLFSSYLYWFYSHSFSLFLVNLSVCDWYLSSLPYKYITKMEVFYCFWGTKVLFHLYFDAFLLCVWGGFLLEIHQLYFSNCTLALDSLPPISINTAENTSNN